MPTRSCVLDSMLISRHVPAVKRVFGFLQYEIFRDTATVYLRRPWRGSTQPKFVICANASLRYVFRSSEVWDLGQGMQRVCLTEGLSSITGAISLLSHITSDRWVKAVSFGAQPKLISNELMLALPLHFMHPHLKSRTLAPVALVLCWLLSWQDITCLTLYVLIL